MIKRCISCVKFLTCTDKLKGTPSYSCIKFSKMQEFPTTALLLPKGESSYESVDPNDGAPDVIVLEDLDDNFVADAMRRAYDPETNTIRDIRIDDSDLKLAKNFYDFCFNIIGGSVKPPFARQMWLAYNLLAEFCPKCTKPFWYEDIHNIPVDMETKDLRKKVAFLEHGVCPHCDATRGELIEEGLLQDRTELVMIAGQRSGKSTVTCMLIAYVTHVLLKSPKLSSLCSGIQDFTPLAGTMTALTAGQAIKTLWNPFKKIITASSWYDSVFALLDGYNERYGKELYQFNPATGLYLRFFHKNLDLYSSGPAKRTLRGDTRFLAATDELGLFPINFVVDEDGGDDERERANADEVHQTLSTSLATVQAGVMEMRGKGINHIPQAINYNISSPFSWLDKICKLYLENADNPSVLRVKEPTWEISPLYTREHPIIVAAYRRNSKKAERDFGASPPKIGSDFYKRESVLKCFQLDPWYAINYVASAEDTMGKAVQIKKLLRYPPSVLSLDAGSHNNAFALTLTYRDEGKINIPILLEVVPTKGRAVHFPYLYTNVILPICKACNVKVLTADRWSSLQILQQAKDDVKDLKVAQYSVKMSDFENVINLVDNESIFFPKLEMESEKIEVVTNYKVDLIKYPASHLYLQCITVQEIGGTVTKGASPAGLQYTDDLHRAMVLGVSACLSEKVSNYLSKFKIVDRVSTPGAGIYVGSRVGNLSDMLSRGYGARRG